MNEIQFLLELQKTKKSYKWHLGDKKKIRGVARNGKDKGEVFDPVTAVSRYTGNGTYQVTQSGRKRAGKSTGLSTTLTNTVIEAADAKNNRGGSQVLRGRIKQVLELK
jgi:hypothetical protein|tara:strand:+ start:2005 stop:2328 length:324 start_codon:yes stop_codon:yes gene_type:complete